MSHPTGVAFPRYMRHRQRLNAIRERNRTTVAKASKPNERSELGRLLWRLEEQRCMRLAEWYKDVLDVRAELQRIDKSRVDDGESYAGLYMYTIISKAL